MSGQEPGNNAERGYFPPPAAPAAVPRAKAANDEKDMPKLGAVARRVVKRSGIEALRKAAEDDFSSDMTNTEFRAIREGLGLTQAALAKVLSYNSPMRISDFERATNPREVPTHVAMLMQAFRDGWRPPGWPSS